MTSQIVQLDIKSDVDQMVRRMNAGIKQVKPALNSTINRVATTIRKEGVRELSKKTGLKQKKLRESITLIRSRPQTMVAVIKARGRPFNLISFGAKVKRFKGKSVGITAKPWNQKRFFKGGFLLNVKGTDVAFKRIGKGKKEIKPMFGPGAARESLRDEVIKLYNTIGRRRFKEEFPKQLKFRLDKVRR